MSGESEIDVMLKPHTGYYRSFEDFDENADRDYRANQLSSGYWDVSWSKTYVTLTYPGGLELKIMSGDGCWWSLTYNDSHQELVEKIVGKIEELDVEKKD